MNPYFVAGLLLPPMVTIIMQIVVMHSHHVFLRAIPELRDPTDMIAFKRLAAANMYLALVAIVLQVVLLAVWIVGVLTKNLPLASIFLTFIPFLAMLALGLAAKQMEQRIQTMPAPDPALAAERDRVVETWKHRPFPDW
jgi:uncharacterized membrane protein